MKNVYKYITKKEIEIAYHFRMGIIRIWIVLNSNSVILDRFVLRGILVKRRRKLNDDKDGVNIYFNPSMYNVLFFRYIKNFHSSVVSYLYSFCYGYILAYVFLHVVNRQVYEKEVSRCVNIFFQKKILGLVNRTLR